MIYRRLEEIIGGARDVAWGNGRSRRFLLRDDNLGYSLTDTIVFAGTDSLLEYKNHLEACYCIEGEGEVEAGGQIYPIVPGCLYALDGKEPHHLRAKTDLRLICVFNPALRGDERHQLGGTRSSSY